MTDHPFDLTITRAFPEHTFRFVVTYTNTTEMVRVVRIYVFVDDVCAPIFHIMPSDDVTGRTTYHVFSMPSNHRICHVFPTYETSAEHYMTGTTISWYTTPYCGGLELLVRRTTLDVIYEVIGFMSRHKSLEIA